MKTALTIGSTLLAIGVFFAPSQAAAEQCGQASWYALDSQTASGQWMDPTKMTAAHRKLPFGTEVEVTNERNGETVTVRINDRGPFIDDRVIDVARAVARELGFKDRGVAPVCFTVVE